jgi:uncharacterized protein
MPSLRCPICRRSFQEKESPALPFCSERCRLVDLGGWLDEKYGLAIEPEDAEAAELPNDSDETE